MHTLKFVILFLVFSSPMTYKLVRKVFGPVISTFEGMPHPAGMALHALLFGVVIYIMMSMKCGKSCKSKSVSGSNQEKGAGMIGGGQAGVQGYAV
jgi:hypothetical protein